MTNTTPLRWNARVANRLKDFVIDADDRLDAARRRYNGKFGGECPRGIVGYRGHADGTSVDLVGRVFAKPPMQETHAEDRWWENLLDTYRRFESDEVPGATVKLQFRGAETTVVCDNEGYYHARLATTATPSDALWDNAMVSLPDGTLLTPQPVLQVGPKAAFGVISDIDDTILHSSVLDWKAAAQLTFLHNARTRKPLKGVAKLYQALQSGSDGAGRNPVFYVSSSPWNLYDLLDDFLELNAIPFGPIFLRDIGFDPGKFLKTPGHGHKLERVRELIRRFPALRWVLLGDSGQADAELYAEAAREFGDRILAIYIRDVDPSTDSPYDAIVDGHIGTIAGTRVPMLRVGDSLAIAEHALGLGLLAEASMGAIAKDVERDWQRPTLTEAAAASVKEAVTGATPPAASS
jgi:phosphatidate phosphatase APP1